MDVDIDHYLVLGLPSGEEGSKLTEKEITKAYRLKALELHPDKRPDDPNAPADFQKLQTSYQILKDEKGRKLFDDLLRAKQQKRQRELQHDSKRRRMMSDLDERERASFFGFDTTAKARSEEEIIARKFKEEVDRIRKMHANKMNFNSAEASTPLKKESVSGERSRSGGRANVDDMEKMLRVSWENAGFEYTVQSLREIFEAFGEVKDVVIRNKKKKGSAVIVMATKEAAKRLQLSREPVKSEGPLVNGELVGARILRASRFLVKGTYKFSHMSEKYALISTNESVNETSEISTTYFLDHCEFDPTTNTPLSPNDHEEGTPSRDGRVDQPEVGANTNQAGYDEVYSATPIVEEVGPRRSQRSSTLLDKLNDFVLDSKVKYGLNRYANHFVLSPENYCFVSNLNQCCEPSSYEEALKDSNGEVKRYKARLVAKGFSQKEGIDYEKTFSSMVNMSTDRCLINLVVQKDWKVYQIDANIAFLIWGFKREALRQWNHILFEALLKAGIDVNEIKSFKTFVSNKFKIKDIRRSDCVITAFSNSDWAKCPVTRRSISRYYAFVNVDMYYDNKYAIQIVANPVIHEKTKHFDIDVHIVREKVASGFIRIVKVDSKSQVADILTKALGTYQHNLLVKKLGLLNMFAP
ncbi:DnaJ homolog subfamily C member 17 [Tanacetum coccineum]